MSHEPPDADDAPTPRAGVFHAKIYQLLEYDRVGLAGNVVVVVEQLDGKLLRITNRPKRPATVERILRTALEHGVDLSEVSDIT